MRGEESKGRDDVRFWGEGYKKRQHVCHAAVMCPQRLSPVFFYAYLSGVVPDASSR